MQDKSDKLGINKVWEVSSVLRMRESDGGAG